MAEEKILQTKILNDLRSRPGYVAFKIMKCSDDGCPDLFFTSTKTGAFFIEVKAPGMKPRANQLVFISKLNACGAKAFHIDSWEAWVSLKQCYNM